MLLRIGRCRNQRGGAVAQVFQAPKRHESLVGNDDSVVTPFAIRPAISTLSTRSCTSLAVAR